MYRYPHPPRSTSLPGSTQPWLQPCQLSPGYSPVHSPAQQPLPTTRPTDPEHTALAPHPCLPVHEPTYQHSKSRKRSPHLQHTKPLSPGARTLSRSASCRTGKCAPPEPSTTNSVP
ncbi:hypothetical protein T484DRAFT_1953327 [Baffinella frigidus]|nr:hypothetical protein T484DRAFT_1953327 [Cryptophyta sp. CCMP2293]